MHINAVFFQEMIIQNTSHHRTHTTSLSHWHCVAVGADRLRCNPVAMVALHTGPMIHPLPVPRHQWRTSNLAPEASLSAWALGCPLDEKMPTKSHQITYFQPNRLNVGGYNTFFQKMIGANGSAGLFSGVVVAQCLGSTQRQSTPRESWNGWNSFQLKRRKRIEMIEAQEPASML